MESYQEIAANLFWETAHNVTEQIGNAIPQDVYDHVELTHKACSSTLEAMRLWGLVFYPVVQFVAWCCLTIAEIVMPLLPPLWERIKALGLYVWQLFLTHGWPKIKAVFLEVVHKLQQADPATVAMVVLAIAALIAFVSAVRWVVRQGYISRARAAVGQRIVAAKNASIKLLESLHSSVFHVGLALHAVLCMRYAPQVIEATAHPVIFWLTAAVFPAIGSFRALHELRAEGMCKDKQRLSSWLEYWVVVASVAVVLSMPFMLTLTSRLWHVSVLRVHFVFWLWCPYTNGSRVVYSHLVPLINRFIRQVPMNQRDRDAQEQDLGMLQKLLGALFSDRLQWVVTWIFDVGPAVMASFLFFLTPGFVTEYGVIFVGMAYPVYGSVRALETMPLNARPLPRTPGPAGAKRAVIPARGDAKWLTYWTAFAPIKMCMVSLSVYLGGLPLWHHVELFVDLWLVITGANTIVGELDQLVYRQYWAARDRRERVQEQEELLANAAAGARGNAAGGDEAAGGAGRGWEGMSTPDILGSLFKRRGGGTTTAAAAGGGGGGGAGEASALGRSASDEATDAPGRAEVTPLHANKDRDVLRHRAVARTKLA